MKKILLIFVAIILLSNYSFSQYNLTIEILEIRNNSGKIMLQVYNNEEKIIYQEMNIIKDKKCSFYLKNLSQGIYAIRYFHDENLNGELDTNLVGKPTEGYGFSNNVTGKFGPPPFEKWLFELKEDKKIILKPLY
jgi:uncharacterized protein (DUF2141 family)